MLKKYLRKIKSTMPIFEKYSIVWRVIGETNGTLEDMTNVMVGEKYNLKRCIQFSIECFAVFSIFLTLLKWCASWAIEPWTIDILNDLEPLVSLNAFVLETYIAVYFVFAIMAGHLIHHYFMLFSKSGKQNHLAFSRFLLMYPGLFLWLVLTSLWGLFLVNWIGRSTGIKLSAYENGDLNWVEFLLGFPLLFLCILFASSLLGAIIGFPIYFYLLAKENYGNGGVVGLVLLLTGIILVPIVYDILWGAYCNPSDTTATIFTNMQCLNARERLGLSN